MKLQQGCISCCVFTQQIRPCHHSMIPAHASPTWRLAKNVRLKPAPHSIGLNAPNLTGAGGAKRNVVRVSIAETG